MKFYPLLMFSCIAMLFAACSGKNAVKVDECSVVAMAQDASDVDGCNTILLTMNGDKLNVVEWPNDFEIQEGSAWKIGYEVMEETMTTCMQGEAVRVGCAQRLANKSDCDKVISINRLPWLDKKAKAGDIESVYQLEGLGNSIYYVGSDGKNANLYSCRGKLIASFKEKNMSTLTNLGINLGSKNTLYSGN